MVLLGEYGYLSDFSISPEEIVNRINIMFSRGIREFQFYDWFSSYTLPPYLAEDSWRNAYNPAYIIRKDTMMAAIIRIRELGGRSWAYIQSIAVDYEHDPCNGVSNCPYRLTQIRSNDNIGFNYILNKYSFKVYDPDSNWASRMVKVWAPAVKQLGFSGIHWDTLGKISVNDHTEGFAQFLETASAMLSSYNLLQTFNFVSMSWLTTGEYVKCNKVVYPYLSRFENSTEFLYAEVWNGTEYSNFIGLVRGKQRAVVAFYPTVKNDGSKTDDMTLQEVNMVNRASYSRANNLAYLAVGNGFRRLINEYFMIDVDITPNVSPTFLLY